MMLRSNVNLEKIKIIIDDEYQKIIERSYGLWITGLWIGHDEISSFEAEKEAFFYLIKRLLEEARIMMLPPEILRNKKGTKIKTIFNRYTVWDETPVAIVNYLRKNIPLSIASYEDDDLFFYWFSENCPQVAWVDYEEKKLLISS